MSSGSEEKLELVVVGGGLIGSACARHLTAVMPEARIAVVAPEEPKVPFAEHNGTFASHYDEGRVTRILDPDSIWARLAQESIDRYRDLEKESGIDFFHESGYACIGTAQHSSYLASVQSVADAAGVEYEALDTDALHARFPAMVKPVPHTAVAEAESSAANGEAGLRALLQTTRAGHISPRKMVEAQLRVCASRGVRVVSDMATSVSLDSLGSGKAEVRLAGGDVMLADKVVVCTGAFTKPELTDGVQLPLDMEGRTVVFADVTELMAASPELQLDRLPSVIKALSSSDGGEGGEGGVVQQGEGRPELQSRKGKDREQGPLYDLYCLPPVKYANGRWYIKIGTGDFPNKLRTVEDVLAWFKGTPAGPDVAMLTRELLSLYPVLEACERSTTNCALTYTPHGRPIVDWVREGVLAVAVGGNGAAAKSADEIGRLAARLVAGDPDTTYDMKAFQVPHVGSGRRMEVEVRAVDLDEREGKAVAVGHSPGHRELAEVDKKGAATNGDGDGEYDAGEQCRRAALQLEKDLSLTEVSLASTSTITTAVPTATPTNSDEDGMEQVRSTMVHVQTSRRSPAVRPKSEAPQANSDAGDSAIATTVTRTIEDVSITRPPAGAGTGVRQPHARSLEGTSTESGQPEKTRVYIVRHGERLDEVPDNTWYREQCAKSHGRTYDPPLTDQGKKQAQGAAKFISTKALEVDVLYTSSLIRCVSTAAIIASDLKLKVVAFDALAECAAAVRERSLAGTALASDQELVTLVQEGDATFLHRHASPASRFRQALVELCERHAGRTLLICAHREAIRDLLAEQGGTARLGYCAVAGFEYNHTRDTFRLVDAHKDTVRVVRRTARWW